MVNKKYFISYALYHCIKGNAIVKICNFAIGTFTGEKGGTTTVVATHKPTGRRTVFNVIVESSPIYTVRNYVDQGYRSMLGEIPLVAEYQDVVEIKMRRLFGLTTSILFYEHTSSADICKIDQFGYVLSVYAAAPYIHFAKLKRFLHRKIN